MDIGHCGWSQSSPLNQAYHDGEWGVPVHDDRQMFEHLSLESLQCGLSWSLMLKKRGSSAGASTVLTLTESPPTARTTWRAY